VRRRAARHTKNGCPERYRSAKIWARTFRLLWPERPSEEFSLNQIPAVLSAGIWIYINGLVAAASAATTRATATAAAATTTLTGLGFVYLEGAAPKVLTIERLHGASGIRISHFDESEPTRAPGFTIGDERQRLNGAVRSEQRADRVFSRGEG
jgi:hypothetical protein